MPNHQSKYNNHNNNYNNENIYCRQTLLNLRQNDSSNTDQNTIQTTILSNNQINNYNSSLKISQQSQHIKNKTHYKLKFKHLTHSQPIALRSGPPVVWAEAYCHRGVGLGNSVQKHAGSPNAPRSLLAEASWTPNCTPGKATQHQQNIQHSNETLFDNQHTTQLNTEIISTANLNNDNYYNNEYNNNNKNGEEPSHIIPSRGSTGQPRSSMTCGDQNSPPLPQNRPRNTKRGLRNPNTIEIRKEKRSNKRRVARALHRKEGGGENIQSQSLVQHVPQAKAQEPTKLRMKILLGKTTKFATLNIRGIKKPGVREEIEYWMTEKEIDILCLQETRNKQNSRESRKSFTWFFSGEGGREEYTAGVGMVINNNFLKYVEDIEPVNDRLMYATLRGTIESNIICTYMPPAERQNHLERLAEDKDNAYDEIQKVIDKKKNKGPMYICGDWNARLIYPTSEEEEQIIGKHTLHENASALEQFSNGMLENREKY